MKNAFILTITLFTLSSCGLAGKSLGTATRVLTSPVSVVVGQNDTTQQPQAAEISVILSQQ